MPTFVTLVLTLIQGVGIMALVTMGYSYVERLGVSAAKRALLHGLGFGIGSVCCLVLAAKLENGVFIDARNLFIAFSAAFGGPVALAVTLVLAAVTRIMMGGVAVYAGLAGLAIAGAGGLLWRFTISQRMQSRISALAVLGALTATSLLGYLLLPSETFMPLLLMVAPPFIAVDLMGALVLGSFIEREKRLLKNELALAADAFTDPLTGLLNRRRFEGLTSNILRNPAAASPGSALLIADIDHFKAVNDGYGHDTGDDVLKSTACTIAAAVRPHDLVGRIGGEEFAILIRDVDSAGAMLMAERIRAAVAGSIVPSMRRDTGVTVSIGVRHAATSAGFRECYRLADAALYHAKSAGRNRVETAPRPKHPKSARKAA